MPETDPAPVMEEKAVANGGAAADVAAPEKDMATKEVPAKTQSKDAAVADKSAEEQNKVSENGTEGPKDGDVKMAEAESAKEGDDVGAAEQLDSGDVRKDADTKEDDSSKPAEGEDINMEEAKSVKENQGEADEVKQVVSEDLKKDAEAKEDDRAKPAKGEDVKMAEAGNIAAKDEGQMEDKDENKNVDQQDELKEKEKGGSADVDERKGKETGVADKQEEDEAEEKGSADKKVEEAGDKKFNANEEKAEKDSADNHGKDSKVTEEQVSEADKVVEENKEETPKNKKARSARDRSQGKDKKQDGTKSREAKSLLNTPSPYGTDRPQRERKTVERLVEAIEKDPNKNFVVEKGRGTPLKDIPSVAFRISRKKPGDLKFLHSILFGRKGKAADFKGHILQFSGFVWHESDEKMRAKAKEKLDKCVKDVLLDLCWLFAIPVPKANARKEDIVTKLLDFIAEPHAVGDSGLSDDQGSHSRKRKRGGSSSKIPDSTLKKCGDLTSAKRPKKALEFNSDEDEDDHESMKSDSEENKDEDPDVGADEQEDDYDSGKENAGKMSSEVKESSGRKKTYRGSGHKTGTPRTISKSPTRKSSSKISKEQESPNDSAKVFSRKRKPSSKASAEKETKEKRPSGKKMIKGKGASAEADLPSKDELRKTIIGILKKVDFNTATFSDILKKLDNHYKMDLAPKKEAIKVMIQDELTKLSEADEDEDGQDAGKKQQQHQAKEVKA